MNSPKTKKGRKKTNRRKPPGADQAEITKGKNDGKAGDEEQQSKSAFVCGDEYYASSCLHRKILQQGRHDKEHQVNVAFEANAYHTYQVSAIGCHGFKSTEVLLNNQANTSIMRLSTWRIFFMLTPVMIPKQTCWDLQM